ncbi:FAD-binding and (Fe-S)-binding domain-containing protein [Pedobacter sp. UBA4863]|uniref:FAD-binding and (Fe-S)-binding domain-containing protein n=1 Tax=Pedobacter sp. UBA4863 TaxID=1947060 RepID=UPI0025F12001|nr:FAD-binding and (Fe-S)-binding domain-containing protein [Pedobacter sp. UBA4863]
MEIGVLLRSILPPERIKTRLIDVVAYASDAGFYYLRPKAVVQPIGEDEVIALFHFSSQHKIPLTFRTGGTSLSGQAITDGILVDLSQYWSGVSVEDTGCLVRVQPGITGKMVNARLKNHQRKIGPDPSSIDAAMMGGILSNNSSGMCCGVRYNSYHTTKHIRFILPNGQVFSSENKEDYERFEKDCASLFITIQNLRLQVLSNKVLQDKIRKKYLSKNTVGYSLNALLDYEHPLDIMEHLLVGAEGTLGFIAEAVMETVYDYPLKSTAFLFFKDIYAACSVIPLLKETGAEAVELMDRASLKSIEDLKGAPAILKLLPDGAAALLIEYQAANQTELLEKTALFERESDSFSLLEKARFTTDPNEQSLYWKLRKGMFPAVGAVRKSGTTVILEDVAFPVERLGDAILDIQQLFKKHHYDNGIIFGHAKDGNIHFVVTQSFAEDKEVKRYDAFIDDLVALVVQKYDGTLKAEHGTGRNMAPFVETEWGEEAYQIMKALKNAIDPENLLNPGVIINAQKNAHLQHLKALPTVEEEVDKCIECGYCEHKCPSRNLTLTPRRRIVVRRELAALEIAGKYKEHRELVNQFQYDGLATCAVDGLCASACPVDINTGDLVKRLRRESHSTLANKIALTVAKNFKVTTAMASFMLHSGHQVNKVLGKNTMHKVTYGIKKIIPAFPLWSNQLIPSKSIGATNFTKINGLKTVVYFPTCISRMMGGAVTGKDTYHTFLSVAQKANINVLLPKLTSSLCCGQAFSSKGYTEAYRFTVNKAINQLWETSLQGKLIIILDVSSCTHTLQGCRAALSEDNKSKFDQLSIIDTIDFVADYVIPQTQVNHRKSKIVLHPVCSLQKMGLQEKFLMVARHFAHEVTVPLSAGCCGMAGDRGFHYPELIQSAASAEAREVSSCEYDGYYSSAKTCEMSMSEAVKKNYESVLHLADQCIV